MKMGLLKGFEMAGLHLKKPRSDQQQLDLFLMLDYLSRYFENFLGGKNAKYLDWYR